MAETLESLEINFSSYEKLIKLYTKINEKKENSGKDLTSDRDYESYKKLIKLYSKINVKLSQRINVLKAPVPSIVPEPTPVVPAPAPVVPSPAPVVPSPAPVVPAPSSVTQSVAKSADEQKLEKIKALLQANEAIIKECGFKIEP